MMNRRELVGLASASALALSATGCATSSQSTMSDGVSLGIDQLKQARFAPLKGRRIGFITNQTSVDQAGTMSRVILQQGLGADLKVLFGPEHGLDTRSKAGDHVANGMDEITGLRAMSLYGQNRKPTPEMLAELDVLVFDIQDIGVRSYTYISTMALAMEACGEAGKDFVVLDRPNPLGGSLIQGPPIKTEFLSFVGQVPVPYRHGMTIGELAKMINANRWIKANPRLTVIPMKGWRRDMVWTDTKLTWVPTSPNIPYPASPIYCATTGILGELRDVDIGIGTDKPFQFAAAQGVDGAAFSTYVNSLGFDGVVAKPYVNTVKPGYSGIELEVDPRTKADVMAYGMMLIQEIVRRSNRAALASATPSSLDIFKKVYGSNDLVASLDNNVTWATLASGWLPANIQFARDRRPHLLYR
jgi:uncharacterized protein YbbC (DUF1343 family)